MTRSRGPCRGRCARRETRCARWRATSLRFHTPDSSGRGRGSVVPKRRSGTAPSAHMSSSTIAPATAARWDLEGVLVSVADAVFEAEPAPGEWSIRETLGHAINSQRGYAWGSAWWLEQRYGVRDPDLPPSVAEEVFADFPEDADAAVGSPSDVRS